MDDIPPRLAEALVDRYRLERELGSGGMATVYLAHDLRHDRKVAVKVLRPELAAVIGADRFLAEIKTTAALQQSHILPLFDSGQADGFLFYVMPFVEGESLRDRLRRERELPVDEAVRIAKEVASALDYAHRHGVIHRDIKPENVLLQDGQALVADFGIALAVTQAGSTRMTETGLSLGTPGYMSPEQATGERTLDARSDVYSLGSLLYEMLVGEPPHAGPSVQAIIAAVLTKEPERLAARRPSVPLNVEAAVHKSLAKLPADRFASADAFSKALSEPATAVTMASVPGMHTGSRAPARRVIAIGAALLLLLGALAAWGWLRPRAHPFVTRYTLRLRDDEGVYPTSFGTRVAISPDGRRMVYVGRGEATSRLWMKEAGQLDPVAIQGTEGATSPFFSPDGHAVGFVANSGRTVRVLSLDAGSPLTLTDSSNTTGADWGSDGYVYFETATGIARIRATGGAAEPVYTFPADSSVAGAEWPVVLPGAHGLLFRTRRSGQATADFEIVVQPLPRGSPHALLRGIYARYAASGDLAVVTAEGKLLVAPFDLRTLALTGPAVTVYDGLASDPFAAAIALSDAGTLIYQTSSRVSSREAVWVTRAGVATPVDSSWKPDGTIEAVSLSPNGKSIAVDLLRGIQLDIWVKQLPGGAYSRITFDESAFNPSWSLNGAQVLYLRNRGDASGTPYVRRADGVGPATHLFPSKAGFGQVLESPDGRWLIFRTAEGAVADIVGVHLGDSTIVPLVHTPAREGQPALSPDGKWLAYISDESGTFEVYVRPFPDVSSARWQLSTAGGSIPLWSHSGKEIFFRNTHGDLVSATVTTTPAFTVGAQHTLFSLKPFAFPGEVPPYSVSPDDNRFLMLRDTKAGEAGQLVVTENWFEDLKARKR